MVSGDDKHLKTYDLWPQEQFNKIDWRKAPVVPNEEIYSHPLGLSCCETLPNWLVTGGKDGTIMVRDGTQPEGGIEYECQAHSVAAGGVTAVSSFRGLSAIFTAGGDGSMAVWYVNGKGDEVPRQAFAPSTQRPASLDKYQGEDHLPFEELLLCKEVMREEFDKSKARDKEAFRHELEAEKHKVKDKLEQLIADNL
jgi:WD40 repeat protein